MFKEWAVLDLMDSCDGHEIQIVEAIDRMGVFGRFNAEDGIDGYYRLI